MTITKYEHACFILSEEHKLLVIDPGIFSNSLPEATNVVAVVLTHKHPDHVDSAKITHLIAQNPEVVVYATEDTKDEYPELPITVVAAGDEIAADPFKLQFFGGQHAEIHASRAVHQNVGVLINNRVFYPGDSFVEPGVAVQTLLLPAAAPWMKVGEAMDYFESIKPGRAIPTHDAVLSEEGKQIHDMWFKQSAERANAEYSRLQPGESLEL